MVPGIQQRELVTRDGTRIGYHAGGRGGEPCVVLANGLGGGHLIFRHLYAALEGYRTISWDYRGLSSSAAPRDPRANTVGHQVGDLMEILDAEDVGEVAVVGWSMGVQVALEAMRHAPERVTGMFAINGTSGRTFQNVLGSRLVGTTIPMLLKIVRAQAALAGFASKRITSSSMLIAAMKRFGFVAPSIDVELFARVTAEFGQVDWVTYSDLLVRLDEHDAGDLLPTIGVPVTVITGDRDVFIPAASSEALHRAIPGSRFVCVPGATHYSPAEFPEILVRELHGWLDRIRGWERAHDRDRGGAERHDRRRA